MKKWMFLAAVLIAVAVLSRRPHPARDVAKLEPIQTLYVYMDGAELAIETDTGAVGTGKTLTEAAAAMKANASAELFLDTAEFLLLAPDVAITEEFHALLRPTCKVTFTTATPDLQAVSDYLVIHESPVTLSELRAR
ncbi:MAG: hypothetical protein IJO05_04430 [Oscillospiraceae bacterium]|nr:hypothetical protein [Oscillospiraceae bacterium]